jgi:hypothetical protein
VEVRLGALERAVAQRQESLQVPAPRVGLFRVQIQREVDKVAHIDAPGPALKYVDALEHHHVRRAHDLRLAVDHVVAQVRVQRRPDLLHPALEIRHEPQERAPVVALREPLASQDPALDQHRVRQQESVGGDKLDLPRRPQRLQQPHDQPGRGRLADRDAPAQRDQERHRVRQLAQKRALRGRQLARGQDPQLEQLRQRQVDVSDFVDRHRLAEPGKPGELVVTERRPAAARLPPAGALDGDERGRRAQSQQQRLCGRDSRAS